MRVEPSAKGQLLRDSLTFQVKLLADWLRDVALSPIAVLLTLAGMLMPGDHPGTLFYHLMDFGRRSDAWIDLFSADGSGDAKRSEGIDELLETLEKRVRIRFEEGVLPAGSRDGANAALQRMREVLGRKDGARKAPGPSG